MSVDVRPVASLFPWRQAMRNGHLHAILDATSFTALADALAASGLDYESLFFGEDALFLRGEAPYIVTLDASDTLAVKRVLQAAVFRHAGFVVVSDAGRDDLRRHFKSWLTVGLNEGQDMALFRFYDTRILLAFLTTLSANEAQAFFGPGNAFLAVTGQGVVTAVPSGVRPKVARVGGLPKGAVYPISSHQMEVMTQVTDGVFRARLADFLLRVFWEQGERRSAAERDAIVDAAISDCARLGVCREGDVVAMAVVRLLRPDLTDDQDYWDAVIAQRPNPNQRANAFLAEVAHEMTPQDREMFFGKVSYWWDFGKPGEP